MKPENYVQCVYTTTIKHTQEKERLLSLTSTSEALIEIVTREAFFFNILQENKDENLMLWNSVIMLNKFQLS